MSMVHCVYDLLCLCSIVSMLHCVLVHCVYDLPCLCSIVSMFHCVYGSLCLQFTVSVVQGVCYSLCLIHYVKVNFMVWYASMGADVHMFVHIMAGDRHEGTIKRNNNTQAWLSSISQTKTSSEISKYHTK